MLIVRRAFVVCSLESSSDGEQIPIDLPAWGGVNFVDCMQTIRTPEKRELFLKGLTEFHGNVSKALEAANLSRSAAYDWKKEDEDFSTAWDDIVEAGTEELEQEAWRRAHEGWLEPVFYQGEEVGHVRKFSDTLLIFTLKGRKPDKYRDSSKVELGGVGGGPITVRVVYDQPK